MFGKKPAPSSAAYLSKAREEIRLWETGKRGYLAKLGDFVMDPAARLTAKTIPKAIQQSASQVIAQTLQMMAQAGEFSVDVKAITKKLEKHLKGKRSLGLQLKARDKLAVEFWRNHCAYAAAEGVATGVIGLAGLVTDIPLILSIAIREIRTIGLCYGVKPNDLHETDYALHILRLGSSGDIATKAQSLKVIKEMEQQLARVDESVAPPSARKQKAARVKYLITIQEYAKMLALEMVQRRALQLVPVVGAVTGASFNAAYANDIGRAAYMCYRRRFLGDESAKPNTV